MVDSEAWICALGFVSFQHNMYRKAQAQESAAHNGPVGAGSGLYLWKDISQEEASREVRKLLT